MVVHNFRNRVGCLSSRNGKGSNAYQWQNRLMNIIPSHNYPSPCRGRAAPYSVAISQHIRSLEEFPGKPKFDRSTPLDRKKFATPIWKLEQSAPMGDIESVFGHLDAISSRGIRRAEENFCPVYAPIC